MIALLAMLVLQQGPAVTAIRAGTPGRGKTLHGCCIGVAPRRDTCFRGQTLRIAREAGRRTVAREGRDEIDGNAGVKLTNIS